MRAIWVVLSLLRCDWSTWVTCQNDVKSMQIRSCDRLETIDLLSLLLSDWLVPRVASITTLFCLVVAVASLFPKFIITKRLPQWRNDRSKNLTKILLKSSSHGNQTIAMRELAIIV